MLNGQDDAAFDTVMRDLALAFDRPHDVERVRVFWEALKHVHISEVKRLAASYRKNGKRFPTPRDLTPEKTVAPAAAPTSVEDPAIVRRANDLSTWSKAANVILFHVAYCDPRRGMIPLGAALVAECLRVKRDIVGMAEQDERAGQPWGTHEFNTTCRQAFEKILGLTDVAAVEPKGVAA